MSKKMNPEKRMLKIIVDGSADMPEGWTETYRLNVLPMPIQFGETTYYQGEDIDSELFYALVESQDQHPKTAAPSPFKIKAFVEKISEMGETVLSINVSSKMSSTFKMVQNAAQELADRIQLVPFDSHAGSAVLAFMAREARRLADAGETIESILEKLSRMRDQIMVVLTLNSLDFAHRSGRVNALKAALSSFLKIKPVVSLKEGLMEMSEMVRTRKKSLERIVSKVVERFGSQRIRVAIVHARDQETAELLQKMLDSAANIIETVYTELSISVAANLGPKTVGVVAMPEDI
jgi:DegV family protein with EDD domain